MFNIIIPSSEQHVGCLKNALESIQSQTIEKFNAVVVGDGFSPYDGMPIEVKKDSRFVFWSTEKKENIWGTSPRNFGLEKINPDNKYLCYLDADNRWLPRHLEICESAMRESNVFCSAFYAVDVLGNCIEIAANKMELGRIDTSGICIDLKAVDKKDILWEPEYIHDFILFDRLSKKYTWSIGSEPSYIYSSGNRNMINFIKYGIQNSVV